MQQYFILALNLSVLYTVLFLLNDPDLTRSIVKDILPCFILLIYAGPYVLRFSVG